MVQETPISTIGKSPAFERCHLGLSATRGYLLAELELI